MKVKYILWHVMLPLFVGGFIYLVFRDTSLLLFDWLEVLGLKGLLFKARRLLKPLQKFIPDFFIYSLPDGLWVYAITANMTLIWRNVFNSIWPHFGLLLGIGIEILQSQSFIPGVYDNMDIILCVIMYGLAIFNLSQMNFSTIKNY